MAKKISELDSPTLPLSGSELMEMSQDGTSVQVTVIQLGNSISYIDRGDNSTADLTQASMTLDGAWYDWDVSSVVPEGAVAIELAIQFLVGNVGKVLSFRKKGNSNDKNTLERKCLVAAATHQFGGKVSCDTNRVVQYFATAPAPGAWTNIELNIRGWYI